MGGSMRHSAKPFPVELIREIAKQGAGVWCRIGVVKARPGGGERFEIEDGAIRVDVQLQGGEPVFAALGTVAAGQGVGVWSVPPAGAAVLVAFPDGSIEGEAIIVAVLDTGQVPDGLGDDGNIIIAVTGGAKVLIHDGNAGDAKALATKDDVNNHTHDLEPMKVITTAAAGTWDVIRDPPAPPLPPKPTKKPDPITGTTVLKAK